MINYNDGGIGLVILGIIVAIIHGVNWVLAKGVILVANELFNINWYNKFWAVYIMVIIVGMLCRNGTRSKG